MRNPTYALCPEGIAAFLASVTKIIGRAPSLLLCRNNDLVTGHFKQVAGFSGKIDICRNVLTSATFSLIIKDAPMAQRFEEILIEHRVVLPEGFVLGSGVEICLEVESSLQVELDALKHQAPGLCHGIAKLRDLANKHQADGVTNFFDEFIKAMEQVLEAQAA